MWQKIELLFPAGGTATWLNLFGGWYIDFSKIKIRGAGDLAWR